MKKFHYSVTAVPTVDDRIAACQPLAFEAGTQCWTELDQYLMERVAPKVPLVGVTQPAIASSRVLQFSFDQATTQIPMPALDQIALTAAARREPAPAESVSPTPTAVPALPDGTYRVTVTDRDQIRAGADPNDADGLRENGGTYTITISHGRWRSIQESDQFISLPVSSGIFYGSGDTLTWVVELPVQNALVITLRWRVEGSAIRFTVVGVDVPDALPSVKALFGAHPWGRTG